MFSLANSRLKSENSSIRESTEKEERQEQEHFLLEEEATVSERPATFSINFNLDITQIACPLRVGFEVNYRPMRKKLKDI